MASVEMAALLLERGAASPRWWRRDRRRRHRGRQTGHGQVLLLEQGADVDEIGIMEKDWCDDCGTAQMGSVLHKAVAGGHLDLVKFLLAHGTDINLPDFPASNSTDESEGN